MPDKINNKERNKITILPEAVFPEVIKYLSNEINNNHQNAITFRTRVTFIIWAGPLILLSSLLVSTKGNISIGCDLRTIGCIAVFLVCYLILGCLMSLIELNTLDILNQYRYKIFNICKHNGFKDNFTKIEDNFTKYKVIRTYMGAFFLIAVSFIAITILVTKLNINTDNVDDGQKEVQKKHQIYQPVR